MISRRTKLVITIVVGIVAAAGLFLLGRLTAHTAHTAQPRTSSIGGYVDGLRDGAAQGREEGRVLQEGAALPAKDRHVARDAFRAGYAAGANDVFAGYDGGWTFGMPWVVTLTHGGADISYRIRQRTPIEPGISYFLCPDGRGLCHQRR